jgi:hypothetical protein
LKVVGVVARTGDNMAADGREAIERHDVRRFDRWYRVCVHEALSACRVIEALVTLAHPWCRSLDGVGRLCGSSCTRSLSFLTDLHLILRTPAALVRRPAPSPLRPT